MAEFKPRFLLKQSIDGKTSLVVGGLFLIDPQQIASTLSDFDIRQFSERSH